MPWLKRNEIYYDEKCREIALKYDDMIDFSILDQSAYDYAKRNNLLESFDWLKKKEVVNVDKKL